MKIAEIRELSTDELLTRRRELKEEALQMRVQQQTGQLENTSRIRSGRREVAQIETILSERRRTAASSAE